MKITKKQGSCRFEDLNVGDVFEYPTTGVCIKLPREGNINAFSFDSGTYKCFCDDDMVTPYPYAELILK